MAGKTHNVTIRGEEMVQACERRFGSYCGICTAEEQEAAPVTPSRGRPMSAGRLRSMRRFEWVGGERVELGPELPFRPSVGTPAGWSETVSEEV